MKNKQKEWHPATKPLRTGAGARAVTGKEQGQEQEQHRGQVQEHKQEQEK
jgi:hypothetical protein